MNNPMTQEQIDKMNVRNVLRQYMKTPGATMETDVFVAMVKLVENARKNERERVLREMLAWNLDLGPIAQDNFRHHISVFACEHGIDLKGRRGVMELHTWDEFFLGLADYWAQRSKDPNTKVGAVIVDNLRRQVASGYNGFPRAIYDAPALLENRDEKLTRIIHAEMNAILTARTEVRGCTLYVSLLPCCDCAKHVVQAGLKRIVARAPTPQQQERWGAQFAKARALYEEAGVAVTVIPPAR